MENMDTARKIIKDFIFLFMMQNKLYTNICKIDQYTNQILFELLKEVYIENLEKRLTLHEISGDVESTQKMHSRTMQYSNYYRSQLADRLEEEYNFTSPVLEIPDMKELIKRRAGYRLNGYDVIQMEALENLILLKNIANRRITDVKKISEPELKSEFNCYLDYFRRKFKDALDDEKFVMYSILLFTTELKYHVMSIYFLADRLSAYQNSRSKNKFPSDYITNMRYFNSMIVLNVGSVQYLKENSLILPKIDTIKKLTPDNLTESTKNHINDLFLCMKLKQLVRNIPQVIEYIQQSSDEERRNYIDEYYPIYEMLDTKLTWEHKKGKYVRELYASLIQEIEPPKIG